MGATLGSAAWASPAAAARYIRIDAKTKDAAVADSSGNVYAVDQYYSTTDPTQNNPSSATVTGYTSNNDQDDGTLRAPKTDAANDVDLSVKASMTLTNPADHNNNDGQTANKITFAIPTASSYTDQLFHLKSNTTTGFSGFLEGNRVIVYE